MQHPSDVDFAALVRNYWPMPLHYSFARAERLVVVIAKGFILPEEIMAFLTRIDSEGAQTYGKLFDVIELETVFSEDRVRRLGEVVRHRTGPAGPIAIVARNESALSQARVFIAAVGDVRKVSVFEDREAARNWLQEQGSKGR